MIKVSAQQRETLLAHLQGEQQIVAAAMRSIGALALRGLIKTIPPTQRPRRSALTPAGRTLALQLQAEAIT